MSALSSTASSSQTAGADPATVITTTVFTSATSSAAASAGSANDVPIAAIAGGAAAGVFLAVAAVLVWHWWGWSIKRKEDQERKEAFDFLQLRENTRRNASTLVLQSYTTYRPSFKAREHKRKVKFAGKDLDEKAIYDAPADTPVASDVEKLGESKLVAAPRPPAVEEVARPPLAHVSQNDIRASHPSRAASQRTTSDLFEPPNLAHKSSTVSSISNYSTQSGEEHQVRAPSSLIMAALGRLDPRRPLSATYRRSARHSATTTSDDLNRLSQISAGSAYLQLGNNASDVHIGLAS